MMAFSCILHLAFFDASSKMSNDHEMPINYGEKKKENF